MFAEEDNSKERNDVHLKFQMQIESNLNIKFLLEFGFKNISSSFSLLSTPLRSEVNSTGIGIGCALVG